MSASKVIREHWFGMALAVALGMGGCAPAARNAPVAPAPGAEQADDEIGGVERPVWFEVVPPPEFQQAVENGTRTTTGEPGPNYWQNWADYRIESRLYPEERRMEGQVRIRYYNRSPDTLNVLVVNLTQNVHAEGAVRNEPAEVTGGVELTGVMVAGRELTIEGEGPRYVVQGTKLVLQAPDPVLPGQEVDLEINWELPIPQAGAGARMGYDSDNLFFLAYWYPQMAVYDDVIGWHPDPFLGTAEFYAGFGNYDVTIEAPAGWLVMGTGELVNAEEVLAAPVLERLRRAEQSDSVVHVLTASDVQNATPPGRDGILRWHFQADSVRDVAYSATRESLWDVTRTPVGDRDGDGETDYVRVGALYREPAFRWQNMARYEQHAIRFLSEFTGYSYPWSHMTAVEGAGIMGGGMEYPMMTLIGPYTEAGDTALYNVTVHELAHMWVPMTVATDERRFGWMDEGTTSFNENEGRADFFPGSRAYISDQQDYIEVALAGMEGEMMRRSDYHYPGPAYVTATYRKPASVLVALRGVLGEDVFLQAYREFFDRWAFKHPKPWDMWNTFEDVSGRDLDWFWHSWYYETWLLDQAVGNVTPGENGTMITIRDLGNAPMPALITITRESGEVVERQVPVDRWLSGARTATVAVPEGSPVVRVEIDPEQVFPDVDRENNVWESTGAAAAP